MFRTKKLVEHSGVLRTLFKLRKHQHNKRGSCGEVVIFILSKHLPVQKIGYRGSPMIHSVTGRSDVLIFIEVLSSS